MHLDEGESDLLKGWIVKRLADISDADSDVLADYVLALVKSDEPDDQVRRNCQDNLDDFLKENTNAFIDDVFGAITTKNYHDTSPRPTQNAFLAASAPSPGFNPPTGPMNGRPSNGNSNGYDQAQQSRKRGFQEWDGAEGQSGQYGGNAHAHGNPYGQFNRDRPTKQARRGGRGGHDQQRGGRPTSANNNMSQLPPSLGAMPQFDPNNPLAALMAMQAMGMPSLPGMPQLPFAPSPSGLGSSPSPFAPQNSLPPKRTGERCKDYDNKGFCALGASCPYEHGNDHFVVPSNQDEYDPMNSALPNSAASDSRQPPFRSSRGRGERGAFRGARRGRAEFSMAGPNHDRSVTEIVVEQIPEDKFSEESVRGFFSEFGNIEQVTMQPYKRLAIVKFNDYTAAQKAYDSPKVIFDNRFVKVYWYKPDRLPRPSEHYRSGPSAHGKSVDPDAGVEMQEEEEKIDPVEFAKKQEEAQKAHEEKLKKMKDAESQREELEKKLKAQAEERANLLAKLMAKERAKSGTPDQAGIAAQDGAKAATTSQSQTDSLKEKLAALEKEAETIGINQDQDSKQWQGFAPRGRGGYRGRGVYVPRGTWRGGRGGFAPRGGAVMRLDNRPKTIAVVFPNNEEMGPDKDEALRQYLLFVSCVPVFVDVSS